jgi:predicted enzyme related to lactoylglutathione lyase
MPWSGGSYTMFGVGEGTGGGMVEDLEGRSSWLAFVQVDDVVAATKRARELGATVLEERAEGPAGYRSVIVDPAGAELALWQPK